MITIGINENIWACYNTCTRCKSLSASCTAVSTVIQLRIIFMSIMPPQRKNKCTGGPVRNQQSRRQTRSGDSKDHGASTTTPPLKKRRVQPPLTRDYIPTIVEVVCALLPASTSEPTSTTNGALSISSTNQQSSLPSGTTMAGQQSSAISEHERGQ